PQKPMRLFVPPCPNVRPICFVFAHSALSSLLSSRIFMRGPVAARAKSLCERSDRFFVNADKPKWFEQFHYAWQVHTKYPMWNIAD
ncbi:hypothetical protein, partial [Kingella kingae]|uniref:hypothetical protein n=1 Tax=Kingella kingae TaxID=504 RepID=UPI001E46230C